MANTDFNSFVSGAVDFLKQQDTGGYAPNPPLTQTESAHGVTIRTRNGIKVGRIQNWSPNFSRQIDSVWEVQANPTGEPLERVPQNQVTNSINVERYELYSTKLGQAFGVPITPDLSNGGELYTLILQTKPFDIREVHRDPYGGITAYVYVGCWFSNMGITVSATDDRIVKARGVIEFTRKRKLA